MGSACSSSSSTSAQAPGTGWVGTRQAGTGGPPTAAPSPLDPVPDLAAAESSEVGTGVLDRCLAFLRTSTLTGGQTVRRSPKDQAVFARSAGRRDALRPDFWSALDRLRGSDGGYDGDQDLTDLLTVCEMSDAADTALADELVPRGYPELFAKIWRVVHREDVYTSPGRRRQYAAFNLLKQASINFTHVSWDLCGAMGSAGLGLVALMAEEIHHPLMSQSSLKGGVKRAVWDSPRETLKKTISVLSNIIRMNADSKPVFRQANIVSHLKELLRCRFLIMRAKALFCLVYLTDDDESEALSTTDDNIGFVIKVLGRCLKEEGHFSEHYTFSAEVVVRGILKLGLNDSNKVKLVEKGVLPQLITMLKTESLAEKLAAAKAVWKLAFHEENKEKFKTDSTLITVLQQVRSSETDQRLLRACNTVLWLLDVHTGEGKGSVESDPTTKSRPLTSRKSGINAGGDVELLSLSGDEVGDDDKPHVMISYQWGVQNQMIMVKKLLKAAGYNVWMDVDNMGESTLESMAAAVERSVVVLICFTEKYKGSASCRTEAEYTYKLQKSIVPLRLQEDYDPDGWLGIMIGTKLYVDLSNPDTMQGGVAKLKQLLGERGRCLKDTPVEPMESTDQGKEKSSTLRRGASTRHSVKTTAVAANPTVESKAVSSWTVEQVGAWLDGHGLGGLRDRFHGYTGRRLLGLKAVAAQAPDFFFAELKRDLGFRTLLEVVAFKQALDEIL